MTIFQLRKRFWKILLITATLFLLAAGFIAYKVFWDPENTKQVYYPLSAEEKGLLRHGDILMRQGYGMFSEYLVSAQDVPYPVSHCAMLINDGGTWKVVHALSSSVAELDGVQKQPLQRFLNESVPNTLMVMRLRADTDTIRRISNQLERYAALKVPFDHQFNNADTAKLYCSEVFHRSFRNVYRRDIFHLEDDDAVYPLTVFQDTTWFEVVLNHQLRKH